MFKTKLKKFDNNKIKRIYSREVENGELEIVQNKDRFDDIYIKHIIS